MKNKKIFSTIILITMVVMLLAMPIKIFAADDLWEELGGSTNNTTQDKNEEANKNETPSTNESQNTNKTESTTTSTDNTTNNTVEFEQETSKPSTTTTNTTYNKAGLAEDSIMIVSIVALGVIAIYTFKKSNQYKNI